MRRAEVDHLRRSRGTTVPNLTYAITKETNQTELISSLQRINGPQTEITSYDPLNRSNSRGAKYQARAASATNSNWNGNGNRTKQSVNFLSLMGTWARRRRSHLLPHERHNLLDCRQTVEVKEGKCTQQLDDYRTTRMTGGEELAITPKADTSGSTFAYTSAGEEGDHASGGSAQAIAYGGTGQGDLSKSDRPNFRQRARTHARSGVSWHELLRTYPGGLLIDQRTPSGTSTRSSTPGNIIALVELERESGTNVPLWALRRQHKQRRDADDPVPIWLPRWLQDARRKHGQGHVSNVSTILGRATTTDGRTVAARQIRNGGVRVRRR